MATLERAYEPTASTSAFDPTAVPAVPTTLQHHRVAPQEIRAQQWQQEHNDDLISLGKEQLFLGTRRVAKHASAPPTAAATVAQHSPQTNGIQSEQLPATVSTPTVSEELLGSLGVAKRAFLLALSGLLGPHLDSQSTTPDPSTSTQPLAGPSQPTLINPFASPSSLVVPEPSTPEPDALIASLVHSLRAQSGREGTPMLSVAQSSPLLGSNTRKQVLMEELQSLVDSLAIELPPLDAELARSLGSLLVCIERLVSISRAPGTTIDEEEERPQQPSLEGSPNVYLTLEREARALQSNKDQWEAGEALAVVGAAREVEQAERELLWGRVDDLSERVGALCRERAAVMSEVDEEEEEEEVEEEDRRGSWTRGDRDGSLYEASITSAGELPRYSTDPTATTATGATHLPPAYFHDYTSDSKSVHDWEKPPLSPDGRTSLASFGMTSLASPQPGQQPRTRTRRISTSHHHNEKMQRDLDSVSMAIERLYIVSPQLANQRVEPDRRLLRERQLVKLGNAIERLSKGRLDDQRAAPSPSIEEEPWEKAARLRKTKDQALDRLIDQIDRAASRTLTDQRVDLNGKRREALNAATQNASFEPLSDSREAERREFILEHTGKGRLASQDAVLHNTGLVEPFPGPPQRHPGPVSISEFFAEDYSVDNSRPRSNSLGAAPLRKKFSTLRLGVFKKPALSSSRRGSYDSRTESGAATPTSLSRRGSYDSRSEVMTGLGLFGSGMSRSGSSQAAVLAVSALDFIAEESRNLGTITVTFWPRIPSSKAEEYEITAVETEALLVAPTRGGPASRLALPCRVIPQAVPVTSPSPGLYEAKLITIDPSPTRSRPDLEVHVPLSTAELRDSLPTSFNCATCHTTIVDSSNVVKYNALPSEHWAELLDAWMCHQDQTLSDDLVAKGKGIKPRTGEGLVGSSYVVFEREITKGWLTPEKSESTRSEADDLLHPAHCASCNSLLGQHVTPMVDPTTATCFRLLKYASYPTHVARSPDSTATKTPMRYSLASHLTAEMLEIGQAHACHRFVVEDAETESAKLLLWLFNPAVRISFSTSNDASSRLLEDVNKPTTSPNGETGSSPTSSLMARTMNAVKVFYLVVKDENDKACQDFINSTHSTTERITYPLAVTDRLKNLLLASSGVYPTEKKRWGEMEVGFLERI